MPDATLEELRQRLGVPCSLMAISRPAQLRLSRKMKILHAQERDRPELRAKRRDFRAEVAGPDPQRLVFVDEGGAYALTTRIHGRAPVGERVYGIAPGYWETITLTCGLRRSGVTAAMV